MKICLAQFLISTQIVIYNKSYKTYKKHMCTSLRCTNCKYNLISVHTTRIRKSFLCVYPEVAMKNTPNCNKYRNKFHLCISHNDAYLALKYVYIYIEIHMYIFIYIFHIYRNFFCGNKCFNVSIYIFIYIHK